MGRTTKEIRKRIQIKEEKLERPLTQDEIDRIVKSVTRRVRRENTIRAIWLSIGLSIGVGAGVGGHALLTSGDEQKQPNRQESESEIDIDKKDDKITFKDGLVVSVDQLNEMNKQEDQLRKSIEAEIDGLETSQEVLDYIKNIYAEEYNNKNEEDITKEHIKFNKSRADKEIYEDTATNGDSILRYKTVGGKNLYNQTGVITVDIENDNGKDKEQITKYNNKYQTIYNSYEEVEKNEDSCLMDVAEIIDTGIDWSVAMKQNENSYEVKQEYKNRLIDAVTKYKTEKTNEIEDQER